jgi:hypothetical protein
MSSISWGNENFEVLKFHHCFINHMYSLTHLRNKKTSKSWAFMIILISHRNCTHLRKQKTSKSWTFITVFISQRYLWYVFEEIIKTSKSWTFITIFTLWRRDNTLRYGERATERESEWATENKAERERSGDGRVLSLSDSCFDIVLLRLHLLLLLPYWT